MQSPSFLAYQRHMEEQRAQNNARSLFEVETIPSDRQMRNLLDPVEPSYLRAPFWEIYERLQASKHLNAYESIGGTLLCSLDGTRFFASQQKLGPRRTFFNDLRALTRYLFFASWEDLLIFMRRQLELSPG